MRKLLIAFLLVIVTMSILWILFGLRAARFADEFIFKEIESVPIHSISYQGTGDGGTLSINGHKVSLDPPTNPPPRWWSNVHIGSTKENQLAIAYVGRVFAFGALRSGDADTLGADVPQIDSASLKKYESYVPWRGFQTSMFHLR